MLAETALIATGGALLGLLMVLWIGPALIAFAPVGDVPLDFGGDLNLSTLGITLLAAMVATLLAGTAPALVVARTNVNTTLKESARPGGSSSGSHRLRGFLATSEMTLAMIALIGAGLFFRSFRNASGIQPGFDRHNVSVSQFYLSYAGYSAREQWDFCRALRQRMESKAGVAGVTYSDVIPMSAASGAGTSPLHQITVGGYVPAPDEQMMVHRATVAPGYFQVLGIRLLEGRDFTELDDESASRVVIVNETFARRFFPAGGVIGRKMTYEGQKATVVGLAKDSKYHTPIEGPTPFFYVPFRQWFAPGLNFALFLKTRGDPALFTATLTREALALNQDALFTAMLLAEANTRSLLAQRVAADFLGVLGGIALLLAALGLYSVMNYTVRQRISEMGIRMALGARPRDVSLLVLRQGLRLVIPGLLVGTLAALIASRFVGTMLVNISPSDPTTILAAAGFLFAVAALATYLPAISATRADPMLALRAE